MIFVRSVIIYVCLLILMRLMGKRQLSELQPFEFVITLILADLACVPMAEISIPIAYGLVPIFSIFLLHILLTLLSAKSLKLRKIINGTPQVIISKGNICPENLKKLGMHTNDLIEGLRTKGYFSPLEVEYALVETNGTINVLPKSAFRPLTPKDTNIPVNAPSLPVTLISEGRLMSSNIENANLSADKIKALLKKRRLNQKDVMLLTVDGGNTVYLQPYKESFDTFTESFSKDQEGETP